MILAISFAVVFATTFGLFYFFLVVDPQLEKSKKVQGRIRMVSQGEAPKGPAADPAATISLFRDISLSDIQMFHRLLARFQQMAALQKLIDQSNLRVKAGVVVLISGLLFLMGIAFSTLSAEAPFWVTLPASLGLATLPTGYILFRRRQRFRRFEAQFPQALDLIARALKAGYSFTNALEMTAAELPDPVSLELKVIYNLQSLGWTLRQTLMNFVDRMPLPDAKLFVTAALIHKDVGGNLSEVLETAAGVIRQRFVLRRQLQAMTAQARMSGRLMTGLPFGVIAALLLIAPEYINQLREDPLGWTLLAVGGVMLLTGVLAIQWLLHIKEM